jgi:hypothetical protein
MRNKAPPGNHRCSRVVIEIKNKIKHKFEEKFSELKIAPDMQI